MIIKKFLHTRFRVSDIERSIAFYTKTFGLTVIERKQSARGSKLAFLEVPNSDEKIELAEYAPAGPIEIAGKDITHIAFAVDSLAEFGKHLKSVGVEFSAEPAQGIAFVDDPDGYEIELIEK